MKLISLFIAILFTFLIQCKQANLGKPEVLNYDLIKMEGSEIQTVIKTDSLGNKLIEGNIINGKKNGAWVTYAITGEIIDITNYIDDIKQGPYIKLSGHTVSEQGSFKNNKFHGTRFKYLYGHLDEKIDFKDGIRNGWARKYYSNGNVQREMEILDSVQVGLYRFYGENGTLQIEEKFKDGKKVSGGIVK